MNYFNTVEVNENIVCIESLSGEMMYLIKGQKSAALIDTGIGLGNLRKIVNSLTGLPYVVLLTHGHLDHLGGSFLYDAVYLDPKDVQIFHERSGLQLRKNYAERSIKGVLLEDADFVPVKEIKLLPIKEAQLFDLGGLTIEAVSFPGHTPGSLAFLIKEQKILITGDACNPFTFMFLPESVCIEEYQKNVKRVIERENEYDRVFVSHGSYEVPKSVIHDVYDCCTDILSGTADDVPFNYTRGGPAFIAKRIGEKVSRVDGRSGNIVYSKTNIRNK